MIILNWMRHIIQNMYLYLRLHLSNTNHNNIITRFYTHSKDKQDLIIFKLRHGLCKMNEWLKLLIWWQAIPTRKKNKEKVLSSEETLLLIKYAWHGTLDGDPSKHHKFGPVLWMAIKSNCTESIFHHIKEKYKKWSNLALRAHYGCMNRQDGELIRCKFISYWNRLCTAYGTERVN